MTPEDTPEVTTPEPVAAPPTPEPAAAPPMDGPWAKDLAENFADPQLRAQVDTFLRGRVQPYTTQLETQLAGLKGAQDLITDLQANPGETYLALADELFGTEAAQQLRDTLTRIASPEAADDGQQQGQEPAPLDPRVAQFMEAFERDQISKAYDRELDALIATDPEINRDLFHDFVAGSNGNLLEAQKRYHHWVEQIRGGAEPAPNPEAPPVLGSDTNGAPTPPIQPHYESIGDAIDSFFAEQKAGAPPPVGAV